MYYTSSVPGIKAQGKEIHFYTKTLSQIFVVCNGNPPLQVINQKYFFIFSKKLFPFPFPRVILRVSEFKLIFFP